MNIAKLIPDKKNATPLASILIPAVIISATTTVLILTVI